MAKSREEYKKTREEFKKHVVARHAFNLALRALSYANKTLREMKDPAIATGFIEGAIIGSAICSPVEDSDRVNYEEAGAGRFLGYDLNRAAEFPKAHKKGRLEMRGEGRMMFFRLDEIIDNPPEQRTPTGLLNVLNVDHFFSMDSASPTELIDEGLLVPTTHEDA